MTSSPPEPEQPRLIRVFSNKRELRAGWRLLVFGLVFLSCYLIVAVPFAFIVRHLQLGRGDAAGFQPAVALQNEIFYFLVTLMATTFMARVEGRPLGCFGLPLTARLFRDCGVGVIWGLASLSALLGTLRLLGSFYFGPISAPTSPLLKAGALLGLLFIFVGFAEEYFSRGYLQYTLASGIGFWPAAAVISTLFAVSHQMNPGENASGVLGTAVFALFLCFTLKRTGALWFAIGYHAAWDWGETFFYGTPDSGLQPGVRFFHSSWPGRDWLTGGTAGPEGSILLLPLTILLIAAFDRSYKRRSLSTRGLVEKANG